MRSSTSSMKKIRAELLRKSRGISHITASRCLSKEVNMKSYKPTKKQRLTAAMKAKRLQFANNHQHWTANQWGKVLFSDKSTFQQFVVCFCLFFCFICHFYPPFTRKRIVSLYFGREVRTRLGVAFFEVYGPPVFHIKAGASR